jgi:pimeloyl-ACP methyl ester carboxylesterase
MPHIELSAGVIEYEDTGGDGPAVVLLHGLLMDGTQWRRVVEQLRPSHRCLLPTLPMGAHRQPMKHDADLSLRGMGRIVAEFLERLGLRDVTLCFNDWCGAQVMIADGLCDRVGGLVLVSCEAFDNYPPGLPGHIAWLSAKVPGGYVIARRVMLVRALRETPPIFGRMSKRGVPNEVVRAWVEPLKDRAIRRDLRKYAGQARGRGRRDLAAATPSLSSFDRPALIIWATEDRVMPPEHGRRLADLLPRAYLVEIADSYTLIPEDQPQELANAIRDFVARNHPPFGAYVSDPDAPP